jgi:hypothetical protein
MSLANLPLRQSRRPARDRSFLTSQLGEREPARTLVDTSAQTSLCLMIVAAPHCRPAEEAAALRTRTVLRGALSVWFNVWLKAVIRRLTVFDFDD